MCTYGPWRYFILVMFTNRISKLLNKLLEEPAACVRCGYCCVSTICMYGREDLERGGCMYLIYEDHQYGCTNKLAMKEMKGSGCHCSFMNTWREGVMFRGWTKK
jgi:hypothetical protein